MRSFLLRLCTISLTLALVLGRSTNGCPNGKQPGDTWTGDGCTRCSCDTYGFGCVSCGLFVMGPDCYLVEGPKDADYPKCCESALCRGDPGFDESLLSSQ